MLVWCSARRPAPRAKRSRPCGRWHGAARPSRRPAGPARPARPRKPRPCRPGQPRGYPEVAQLTERRRDREAAGPCSVPDFLGLFQVDQHGNSSGMSSAISGRRSVYSLRGGRSPRRNRSANSSASSSKKARSRPTRSLWTSPWFTTPSPLRAWRIHVFEMMPKPPRKRVIVCGASAQWPFVIPGGQGSVRAGSRLGSPSRIRAS